MNKIKTNNGNLTVMVVLIVSLMALITVQFTKASKLDSISVLYEGEKVKADFMVDHGLTRMLKDIAKFYMNKDDENNLKKTGISKTIYIPTKANREVSYQYKYKTAENQSPDMVDYKLKMRTKTDPYNHRFYDMRTSIAATPADEEKFFVAQDSGANDLQVNAVIGFELGQIDVTASGNMFYTLSYYNDVDEDADPDESHIKLCVTDGSIASDNNKTITEKNSVSIMSLYQTKDPGTTKNILSLDEYLKIGAVTNTGERIYVAIGNKKVGEIDIFQLVLDGTYNIQSVNYIDTIVETFDQFDFEAIIFNDGATDKEELFVITQNNVNIRLFAGYPLEADKSMIQRGNTLALGYVPQNIDMAVLWDSAMAITSPDLYVIVVEEDKKNAHIYNIKPDSDVDFTILSNGDMNQAVCGNMNASEFNINQIELISIYDTTLGVMLYVIDGNMLGDEIFAFYKPIADAGNWNKEEVPHGVDENIGRISGSSIKRADDDYRFMLVNPIPIVKHVTIMNQAVEANIEAKTYNKAQMEIAMSNLRPKIRIEYTEEEISRQRKIEKIEILEYNKNR